MITAVVLLLAGSFGAGYVLARSRGTPEASGTPSQTGPPGSSVTASPRSSATRTASPSAEPGTQLPDGRYFVYAKKVAGDGTAGGSGRLKLTFDLAYLLGGPAANEAAAAHGVETPVPNDYFIVNDNPLLRTYPISPDVSVKYIPTDTADQVKLHPGTIDAWANAVNGTAMTDYRNGDAGWWIVIQGGEITSIKQQYFP